MSNRTKAQTQASHVAVVGFGNILLRDEGVGIHVIQNLDQSLAKNLRDPLLIDGGTSPDILLHLPEEISTLIIVDAVQGGTKPGSIYRFTPADTAFRRATLTSLHQLGVVESLAMMKFLGKHPERVIILGVEPKEIGWGLDLSPELAQIVHQVTLLVKREIANQDVPDRDPAAKNKS